MQIKRTYYTHCSYISIKTLRSTFLNPAGIVVNNEGSFHHDSMAKKNNQEKKNKPIYHVCRQLWDMLDLKTVKINVKYMNDQHKNSKGIAKKI